MDDLNWIWQTVVIFYVGRIILRIGGRKSISQMTITQVIVMIGIGSLLIQPVAGKGLFRTLLIALLITGLMILTEYLEMKFDILETISTGKAKIVIEDGRLNIENLKKLRMSVDRLETRLRQSGISSIDDVKYATIEVSGLIGYELKKNKKPATKKDINQLFEELRHLKQSMGLALLQTKERLEENNLFEEIKEKRDQGSNEP